MANLDLELRTDLEALTVVEETLAQFGEEHGIDDAVLIEVRLALEELITNIVMHSPPDNMPNSITLRVSLNGADLVAELSDDAAEFDPFSIPPPDVDAPLEERRVGGLGIFLVRELMDEATYRREDGRNRVTLLKKLPEA